MSKYRDAERVYRMIGSKRSDGDSETYLFSFIVIPFFVAVLFFTLILYFNVKT